MQQSCWKKFMGQDRYDARNKYPAFLIRIKILFENTFQGLVVKSCFLLCVCSRESIFTISVTFSSIDIFLQLVDFERF